MPPLGHPAACELNRALVKWGLKFEQQEGLFDVKNARHDPITLAMPPPYSFSRWLLAVSQLICNL